MQSRAVKVVFLFFAIGSLGWVLGDRIYEVASYQDRRDQMELDYQALDGSPAPAFDLETIAGGTLTLDDLRGKVVLVNFWFTECAPCRREIPSLVSLTGQIGRDDFVLAAISVDESWAAVRQFGNWYTEALAGAGHAHRFGSLTEAFFGGSDPRMQILLDSSKQIPEAYGTTMYPESYVLDRQGRVRYRFVGERRWNSDTMLRFFRGLMTEL